MDQIQFAQVWQVLNEIKEAFRRMAEAAEAQVKETKAMRRMVERQREDRL